MADHDRVVFDADVTDTAPVRTLPPVVGRGPEATQVQLERIEAVRNPKGLQVTPIGFGEPARRVGAELGQGRIEVAVAKDVFAAAVVADTDIAELKEGTGQNHALSRDPQACFMVEIGVVGVEDEVVSRPLRGQVDPLIARFVNEEGGINRDIEVSRSCAAPIGRHVPGVTNPAAESAENAAPHQAAGRTARVAMSKAAMSKAAVSEAASQAMIATPAAAGRASAIAGRHHVRIRAHRPCDTGNPHPVTTAVGGRHHAIGTLLRWHRHRRSISHRRLRMVPTGMLRAVAHWLLHGMATPRDRSIPGGRFLPKGARTNLVGVSCLFSVRLSGEKHCGQHQGSPQGSGSHGFLFRNRKATGWPSGRQRLMNLQVAGLPNEGGRMTDIR